MYKSVFFASAAALAILASITFHQNVKTTVLNAEELAADNAWAQWKNKFQKHYGFGLSAHESYRKATFKANLKKINAHNATPGVTFKMGLNQFSAMEPAEFKKNSASGYTPGPAFSELEVGTFKGDTTQPVDWTTRGMVSRVKDQGQCGSCWAFSTTGATESALAIFNNHDITMTLSEQELIDCDNTTHLEPNMGCHGGQMAAGLDYVAKKGLTYDSIYKYEAADHWFDCRASTNPEEKQKITSHRSVNANIDDFKAALAVQPLSIAIEADQTAFQSYKTGIVTSGCGQQLDHGVLAVGWGTENGVEYVKVKNSWNTTWGDNGYIKIALNSENLCGVYNQAIVANA